MTGVAAAESASGSGIWSRRRDEITFDRLQKFWNDLPPQARRELLKLDKQTLIEQARKNFYCSRCNGLLLENFKSLQQEVSDIDCLSSTGDSRITQQIESQDPSVHPWGGLATTKDGILTLIDCFIKAKSLRVLQNVFDNARSREREREMLYPDACGGGGRGWISQGMASYSRGYGTRETCALHTAHLSCNTLVNFWSALCEETRSSLLRMKEDDFIERLMYRFDSKRFCRDCRRNVIREFKELKELKRMRRESYCTSWFCVADYAFQCEVFEDAVMVDWRQSLSVKDGSYHHFEWAIGTDEGQSDVFGFENVGMKTQVHRSGIDLDQYEDYFITLRAWKLDGRYTELCVKAHALKGQSCVHHRLVVGDGFVAITKGEGIRSLFEHAEEAEEEDEDDAMERDENDLDGDGSHPQKHAKSPELAREFLLDAAAVIFKEQVEKAFREGAAQQNAQSVFVSLALKLLEDRVHVACKEIITLEKQNKLLEEEEKEKLEEQERRMRRRMKEREKKNRRKERLKEKERDKGKKLVEFKTSDDISSSTLRNSSTCTNNDSGNAFGSKDSASEEEDNSAVVDLCHSDTESSCIEINGQDNVDCYDTVTKCLPINSSEPFTSEQSKPSRRNLRLRKDIPQDQSSCWHDNARDESGNVGNLQWQSMERTRNGAGSCNSLFSTNNRTRDRQDYSSCSYDHQERAGDSYFSPTARSGREMKIARKTGVDKPLVQYRRVGSTQERDAIPKKVWERMDTRMKTCLHETNNMSGSVDDVDSPKPVQSDISGCEKLDKGPEPQGQVSEMSRDVCKSETDQLHEHSEENQSACCDGTPMMNKQNCYSTNNEGSRVDEELMTNSASSDGSSSCMSEADRESSSSSMTSLSTHNPEPSSSDSEESSERINSIAEAPSTKTVSRSLLETCAGNGFREYHPKAKCPPHNERFGFNVSPFQDQLLRHQNMHAPAYSPTTVGPHGHSCAAPTNGYFQYGQPPSFISSPLRFGVPGNQSADFPVQYNNVHHYPAPPYSCIHPEQIRKTPASFRVMPPPPPPPYQHRTGPISGHPGGDLNPDMHSSMLKPMGLKDAAEDGNKLHDRSASFSLFQFNLPIAPQAPPSSKDDNSGEHLARTPFAPVQAQPCSRAQADMKEYNLFSTDQRVYFPLSR